MFNGRRTLVEKAGAKRISAIPASNGADFFCATSASISSGAIQISRPEEPRGSADAELNKVTDAEVEEAIEWGDLPSVTIAVPCYPIKITLVQNSALRS